MQLQQRPPALPAQRAGAAPGSCPALPRCVYTRDMNRASCLKFVRTAAALLALLPALVAAQSSAPAVPELAGHWVFNEKLSDSTDDQVEKALKAMGQKVKSRWFNRDKEYYRGGPAEQELYDRISYDRVLRIDFGDEYYLFTYADDYRRPVYLDDRRRSVSLTGLDQQEDFSFGHWENATLLVEARPRDGGFAEERYRLINNGTQLEARFYIMPGSFRAPVEVKRIFDRAGSGR
jgi:hypothetical protein